MNFLDVFKAVDFQNVMKELVLTDANWSHLSDKAKKMFLNIIQVKELNYSYPTVDFVVDRDSFNTLMLNPDSPIQILSANFNSFAHTLVSNTDLKELSKELIVACAINYLSFEGIVFSEEDYIEKSKQIQEVVNAI